MSITSRINEMSTHIEQAYDGLQGLGADLTNVNKNIENISMVLDDIYDSMPQVSGEGTSLTLDDTRVGKIKSTLKGNTSQTGTPTPSSPIPVNVVSGDNEINVVGKNLFSGEVYQANAVIQNNGTTNYNVNQDVYETIVNSNETYTISITSTDTSSNRDCRIVAFTSDGTYIQAITTFNVPMNSEANKTFTTPNGTGLIRYHVQKNSTNVMLEIGSSATTYEPYQGNTYNIELPSGMELCKIGNYQDYFAKSDGRNLFDKSTVTTSAYLKEDGTLQTGTGAEYITSDFIPVTPNTTYYKTLTLSPRTKFYDKNKQVLDSSTYQDISIGGNAGSFTTPNNAYYFRFTGNVNTSTGININTTMVNEGSSALPYEPYGVGKWYLHKEIGKVVLNGSETIDIYNQNTSRTNFAVRNILSGVESYTNSESIPNLLSNRFIPNTQGATWVVGNMSRRNAEGVNDYLYLTYEPGTTIEAFKTWLGTNNVPVYYVYATPTNTEITYQPLIDQLNLLEKAMSKDGQTNISQVNNDLPFIISASALKEWQESTSLNSTLSMVNPLSLGNTLNTQDNNIQPIEVDNIEPLEEEENEES